MVFLKGGRAIMAPSMVREDIGFFCKRVVGKALFFFALL